MKRKITQFMAALALVFLGLNGCGTNLSPTTTTTTTTSKSSPSPTLLMNYPGAGLCETGFTNHGYYIPSYPGSTLSQIVMWLSTAPSTGSNGLYVIQMSAESVSFSGPVVGTATANVTNMGGGFIPVTFTFGSNPPVQKDSTLFFVANVVTGQSSTIFMDCSGNNTGSLTDSQINLVETNDTTPPYSTLDQFGFGFLLYGNP